MNVLSATHVDSLAATAVHAKLTVREFGNLCRRDHASVVVYDQLLTVEYLDLENPRGMAVIGGQLPVPDEAMGGGFWKMLPLAIRRSLDAEIEALWYDPDDYNAPRI